MNERLHPGSHRCLGCQTATLHVNLPELGTRFGQRNERDIVVDDINSPHSVEDAIPISDIAMDKFNFLGSGLILPNIQDFDAIAPFQKPAGNQISQKAGTASYQVKHISISLRLFSNHLKNWMMGR